MTDRHAAYIVVLGHDQREDDAEHIANAIRMIKGVVSVEPVIGGADVHIAEARANQQWRDRILSLLREDHR